MSASARSGWQRIGEQVSRFDRVALGVVALYGVIWLAGLVWTPLRFAGRLRLLFFLAVAYLGVRGLAWLRREGLWSLRNRLILTYLFIAVVPVVLLLTMGALSAYLIYSQLGAHLLHDDLSDRHEKLAAAAETIVNLRAAGAPSSSPGVQAVLQGMEPAFSGVRLEEGEEGILKQAGASRSGGLARLVQFESSLFLQAVAVRETPKGRVGVQLSLAVTGALLERLAPELGPIQLTVTRPAARGDPETRILNFAERRFLPIGQITSGQRSLPAPKGWLDIAITGFSDLEAWAPESQTTNPVLVSFSARPSQLNAPLFRSLGAFGDFAATALLIMTLIFLALEFVALRIGIQLTRQITRTVDELSRATQLVQTGDFSQTVRVQQRDQLGALAGSFNEMTSSIATLIEEQRHRQRLENELSIAREVQAQLFPQDLPQVPGVALAAVCRAARVVSGDYYDFLSLGGSRLGLAVADISGKGISAALLMASLQATLRSQVLLDREAWGDTAGLVARLNRHLYVNTSPDRYATLFYAAYDADTHTLHYTNAGHLPPLFVAEEETSLLEAGGMVVGLFDDCAYEQGSLSVGRGALLVAYSDGLIECENVYGEEFGRKGVRAVVLRHRNEPPRRIADALVQAAEEWTGSPEQVDDLTVVVARFA